MVAKEDGFQVRRGGIRLWSEECFCSKNWNNVSRKQRAVGFNVLRLIQIEREAVGERVWVISSKGAVRGR